MKKIFYVKEEKELHALFDSQNEERIGVNDEIVLLKPIRLHRILKVDVPVILNTQNHLFTSNGFLQLQRKGNDQNSFCIEII